MQRDEFQQVILQALDELPSEFKNVINNLDIQIRWRPTEDELYESGVGPRGDLFGLYIGIPLTQRSHMHTMIPPDVIYIYQRTHERYCRNEEEMVQQAKKTLLHEIGHYLGIDEDRLHELGMG